MAFRFNIEADLTFSMERASADGGQTEQMSGTLTGNGRHLEVRCDDVGALSSGSSLREARLIAAALAEQGLSVSLAGTQGPIVTIGDVKAGLATRLATRSKHIRIDNIRAVAGLRGSVGKGRGSDTSMLPPPTLFPIAPTFRWSRRRATTTHDPEGGGRPRLVFAMGSAATANDPRRIFHLLRTGTSIGSDDSCDLQLAGIDGVQALVRRDANDEYLIVAAGTSIPTKVNGVTVTHEQVLRTGSRVQVGPWTMTYTREEFADHGRPFGGRAGGEFSQQKKQPPPQYKA
ncbi:MAG: FHA domain-containing protein [Ornithinimicrobium sp.]